MPVNGGLVALECLVSDRQRSNVLNPVDQPFFNRPHASRFADVAARALRFQLLNGLGAFRFRLSLDGPAVRFAVVANTHRHATNPASAVLTVVNAGRTVRRSFTRLLFLGHSRSFRFRESRGGWSLGGGQVVDVGGDGVGWDAA